MRSSVPLSPAPPSAAPAWEQAFPGTVSQARTVRIALRPMLDGVDASTAGDVVLVVSELAANAIAHSDSGLPGGTFTVRLFRRPGQVHVEVWDQGSAWDGELARSARHPHGLYLVTALSAACGTAPGPGRSRRVWARIDDSATGPATAPEALPSAAGPGPATRLPAPDDAARLSRFLQDHQGWSAFWDKACGVWRVAEDDPDSSLYTESADLDTVISYITAHD
jgi:serine/threonine-protein kinase RsbW